MTIDEQSFEQGDALRAEIRSFLECIAQSLPPVVSGEDGLRALETAIRITEMLAPKHGSKITAMTMKVRINSKATTR